MNNVINTSMFRSPSNNVKDGLFITIIGNATNNHEV